MILAGKRTTLATAAVILAGKLTTLATAAVILAGKHTTVATAAVIQAGKHTTLNNNNNNNNDSYMALYPVKIYKLAALYIINIKISLTIKKVQVL